jgi:recombination protein RecT
MEADALSLVDMGLSEAKWERYKQQIFNVMPSHFKKDHKRYLQMYVSLANRFMKDEKVSNKKSILSCLYTAPTLGLNPDPVFGHIFFIPYKGVLTYQIGYKGMIQLSLNSGKIRSIRSNLVYANDEFDYYEDEKGQHYLHRPKFGKKGPEICGYSIFEDTYNTPHFHVMESERIEAIKKIVLSRMKGRQTPWSDPVFEPEMRKKTVIRRHWKTEPMSSEIAQAIEQEENVENGIVLTPDEIEEKIENILESTDVKENVKGDIKKDAKEEMEVQIDEEYVSKL